MMIYHGRPGLDPDAIAPSRAHVRGARGERRLSRGSSGERSGRVCARAPNRRLAATKTSARGARSVRAPEGSRETGAST